MASSIVLRRSARATTMFSKVTHPLRSASIVAPSITRSFNTETEVSSVRGDGGGSSVDVDRSSSGRSVARRRESPLFSDAFDPFSPTRSLTQVMNLMDQFLENPFWAATRGVGATGSRRGFNVKEDKDAVYISMDMPGLGKEDVEVTVEQNTLVIKGEGGRETDTEEEEEDEEGNRRYISRLDLPPKLYKLNEIKAQMKNGVLKVVVPKVKEEERMKNVYEVKVDE